MEKIDLNPAIILLERHLMNMDQTDSMQNVNGMTTTEIRLSMANHNSLRKPYADAIRLLKIANHTFTSTDRGMIGLGVPLEKIIKGL